MQDLLQALQMFKNGVQEAATASAINDARTQVEQIKLNITDQGQQRQAMQQLSNDLALRLTGSGASGTQIQSAFNAIAPQNFGSAEQLQLEGQLSGNQFYQDQANSIIKDREKQKKDLMAYQANLDMQRAMVSAQLKGQDAAAGDPLRTEEVEKIISAQDVYRSAKEMLQRVKQDSSVVGLVDAYAPDWTTSDNGVFRNQYSAFESRFIKDMTGAGLSEEEAKRLKKGLPSITSTRDVFVSQMEAFNQNVATALENRFAALSDAGRDTRKITARWNATRQAEKEVEAKAARLRKFIPAK